MKIRVGITGQAGFIGAHLAYRLKLSPEEIELVPFSREYFLDGAKMSDFVSQCDCIVHLAAMNRGDPNQLYECNVGLVKNLISTMEQGGYKPHIIFSSSIQENGDSRYGASKKEGRRLLEEWSRKTGGKFTGLAIENVFGAFGVPFYNSVVATFCHQLTHGQHPAIKVDASLRLIYVDDLADDIYTLIRGENVTPVYDREPTIKKVSEILEICTGFRDSYIERKIIPELNSKFDIALFNTFRSYLDYDHFPVPLQIHSDQRGWLFEVAKSHTGGQSFYSMSRPGITRGNHFHTRKIERFCVVQGEAVIRLRKLNTNNIIEYKVKSESPCFIDIPIFHTHSITNTGNQEMLAIFWCNEIYNPNDADTYIEAV